ncbi:MAG: hypothetical protein JWP89_2483 [Schlesneria sp.]|nr:hypothetical protein [Schlesneria sp.]
MTFVDIINVIELVWWPALGIYVARRTVGTVRPWRQLGVIAAVTLVVFGLSDAVELYTKAWWRPWWLLVWKAACINILVGCVIVRVRLLRRLRAQ